MEIPELFPEARRDGDIRQDSCRILPRSSATIFMISARSGNSIAAIFATRRPSSAKPGCVQSRHIPREELAAILTEQNTSYGCGPETLGQIEKIVRDRAGAVVTGQQVGLFSGPLYTIYKALTAVKLAADLSRRGLGSFVPVFWLASDDHDLAEIDHIVLLDKDNRLEEVRCRMPSTEGKIPASNLVLPPRHS